MASATAGAEPVSAGHVSMMNDVLISELSPDLLRANLRALLGHSHDNAAFFTRTTRAYLLAHPPTIPPIDILKQDTNTELEELLRDARIRVSAHLLPSALHLLSVPPDQLTRYGLTPPISESCHKLMVLAGGDMLQAAQALKESGDRSEEAKRSLIRLIGVLLKCKQYYIAAQESQAGRPFPFSRAIPQLIDAARLCFPDDTMIHQLEMPKHDAVYHPAKCKNPLPTTKLGNLVVPQMFFGLWQLSSSSWGTATEEDIMAGFSKLVSNGFIAGDMADHYADAEILFGTFRNHLAFPTTRPPLICATKYCQFAKIPQNERIDSDWVLGRVKERSDRLGGVVNLLQVHWQHTSDERYLEVFDHLIEITHTHPDLLSAVGLCNFDTAAMVRLCEYLQKERGKVEIVSNQVQYSLVDHRPRFAMADACKKYGVKLVTYGTFCGGFLSDKWLGQAEPNIYAGGLNTSQRKYYDMIKAWGGWSLFQELLICLAQIGQKHDRDISNVAARWVLDQEETGVVIIGTRLGASDSTSHHESNLKTMSFTLDAEDLSKIEEILRRSRGREMFENIGDCGMEYR